jgi:membrane protein YdbS with pleckstrin-like domain
MDSGSNDRSDSASSNPHLGSLAGRWIVLTVLLLLLVAAAIAYLGWMSGGDTDVPTSGYIAMAIGVIFSLVIGIGLMALLFYSSRKGYDEPAVLIEDTDSNPDHPEKAP